MHAVPPDPAGARNAAKVGIKWVSIPGGDFMMGGSYSGPVHPVTVPGFQMAKTLVTFRQYKACVAAGACTPPHLSDGRCHLSPPAKGAALPASFRGGDHPVVCVDWLQADEFSRWVGGSLPSEAQWEFAARSAGKPQAYPWGDRKADCQTAVVADGRRPFVAGCGRDSTWPVCSKPKGNTAQGLCDMAGNASQWVADTYHATYLGAPADASPWVDPNPAGAGPVFRGGDWAADATYALASHRCHNAAYAAFDTMGLRPVRGAP